MSDYLVGNQESLENQGPVENQRPLETEGERLCAALRQMTNYLRGIENESNGQDVEQMVLEGEVLIMQFEEEQRAITRRLRALTAEHHGEDLTV